jgi:NADPH:quinone reductase-like Zn-dependent oxidoreductase
MGANKGIFGVNIGHLWGEEEKVKTWFEEILHGAEAGWVRPHVDRTFPLEKAGEAHQYIEDRKNTGKVILIP